MPDSKDVATGLPIVSLYGKERKPRAPRSGRTGRAWSSTSRMSALGVYTYITTLGLVLEAAALSKKQVFVLDRPNPIGGRVVSGPVRDEEFTLIHRLSRAAGSPWDDRRGAGASCTTPSARSGRRFPSFAAAAGGATLFDRTGLVWINPSPNMRSLTEALLYPGVGPARGDKPRHRSWDGHALRAHRGSMDRPGRVRDGTLEGGGSRCAFVPIYFTPRERQYAGQRCGGRADLGDELG